jgi:hypothetical protein
MVRTYSELIRLPGFEERFRYLSLQGTVGETRFGFDRIFNQQFYTSTEWRQMRRHIIARDGGCDLACSGHPIRDEAIFIHHLNPIGIEDIRDATEYLLNPEYLICTTDRTHRAIHYGDESILRPAFAERTPNDTCPWKKGVTYEREHSCFRQEADRAGGGLYHL